jgi:hypothetical protein
MKYSGRVLDGTAANSLYKSSNRPLFSILSPRPTLLRCRLTCVSLSIGLSWLAELRGSAPCGHGNTHRFSGLEVIGARTFAIIRRSNTPPPMSAVGGGPEVIHAPRNFAL